MTTDRAIEILNPDHRENYDGLDEVNEACRMGMEALKRQRWIPCRERMPRDADFFPVVIDDDIHGIITGYAYWSGEFGTPIYTDLKLTDDVLYWMPLPEPPEEGGCKK